MTHTFTSKRNTAIGKVKLTWKHEDSRTRDYAKEHPQHFFGSSVATWIADTDFSRIYDALVREGYMFTIWLVKQDVDAPYGIRSYAPDVPEEDLEYLGTWYPDDAFPEKFK